MPTRHGWEKVEAAGGEELHATRVQGDQVEPVLQNKLMLFARLAGLIDKVGCSEDKYE